MMLKHWFNGFRLLPLLASLAWPLCIPPASLASDWPRFLGPTGNAISPETNLLDRWPTNGPPLLWAKEIGTGYSAPSVQGQRVVLHHRIGPEEIVEAIHAASARTLWRHAYPSQFRDPYGYNNGPRCTPLLTSNCCYTFGAEGKLVCLDLISGRLLWQRETSRDWNVPEAFFGVGSTPLLEQNRLIVMVGGQPNAGVVALNPDTGQTLWESIGRNNWEGQPKIGWPGQAPVIWNNSWKQASYSSPVAATIHGRRHLLCLMRQGLVSLNPESGQIQFSYWFRSRVEESVNAMNPVVKEDLILISAAYYRIGSVLLRVHPDGRGIDEVWRDTVLELHWMTPVLHEGYLYGFSGRNESDAQFRCVDMQTGRLQWTRDESWAKYSTRQPQTYGRGSCILADEKLIVLGEGGLLGLFKVNPHQPEEIARFQAPQLRFPCWVAPVLAHQRLYVRSEDHLLCFNLAQAQ